MGKYINIFHFVPCEMGQVPVLQVRHRVFIGYKMEFISFQKPKDVDPSYKMDLDLWDCLGRVKLIKFQRTFQLFVVIL